MFVCFLNFIIIFENRNNKFTYNSWRPVTAIANNSYTSWHTTYNLPQLSSWLSLLETPPHPNYLSGHSTFSAAAGEVLIQFFGDNTSFTLITAGYNGYNATCAVTTIYGCAYQPSIATSASYNRTFSTISSAIYEAGHSRLVGGIHFNFSNIPGIQMARNLGKTVYITLNTATLGE